MPDEGFKDEVAKFEKTVRARNLREWTAATFVAVAFGASGATAPSRSTRLSSWLIVAAAMFVIAYLYAFGRSRLHTKEGGDLSSRFRAELLRQAQLLRRAPLWYVVPLVGGLVVSAWVRQSVLVAVVAIVLGLGVSWLNIVAARGMQRRADALGELRTG